MANRHGAGNKSRRKRVPLAHDRPVRTRSHCIADLGRNHVERFVLRMGHTVEGPRHDYGYDLVMCTYDYKDRTSHEIGEIENGCVYLQLKATDRLTVLPDGLIIAFEIERQHLEHWSEEIMPVVLVVYDAAAEVAYWLYVQRYLRATGFKMPPRTQKGVTLHIPKDNLLDEAAVEELRRYKEAVVAEVKNKCRIHG